MKACAIKVWQSISQMDPWEANENIQRINNMDNIGDNFMTILALFDEYNISVCCFMLQDETVDAVKRRLKSVNNDLHNRI
jgi:hypothetical protein